MIPCSALVLDARSSMLPSSLLASWRGLSRQALVVSSIPAGLRPSRRLSAIRPRPVLFCRDLSPAMPCPVSALLSFRRCPNVHFSCRGLAVPCSLCLACICLYREGCDDVEVYQKLMCSGCVREYICILCVVESLCASCKTQTAYLISTSI